MRFLVGAGLILFFSAHLFAQDQPILRGQTAGLTVPRSSLIAGAYTCDRLLSAASDTSLSIQALQARVTEVLLVDYPLIGSEQFAVEVYATAKQNFKDPYGRFDVREHTFVETQLSELGRDLWEKMVSQFRASSDWADHESRMALYRFDPSTYRQVQQVIATIDKDPRLREAAVLVCRDLYRSYLRTTQVLDTRNQSLAQVKELPGKLWFKGSDEQTWGTVFFGMLMPAGGSALIYFQPIEAGIWDFILGGGLVSVLPLWHFNLFKHMLRGSWSSISYKLKRHRLLSRLKKEAAGKVGTPLDPEIEEATLVVSDFTVENGERSRLRELRPEISDLGLGGFDRFDAPFREENTRVFTQYTLLREKWQEPGHWKVVLSQLNRLREEMNPTQAMTFLQDLRKKSDIYALALRGLEMDLNDGLAAIEQHLEYLKDYAPNQKWMKLPSLSSLSSDRIALEAAKVEGRLQDEAEIMTALLGGILPELEKLRLLELKSSRLRRALLPGSQLDPKAATDELLEALKLGGIPE